MPFLLQDKHAHQPQLYTLLGGGGVILPFALHDLHAHKPQYQHLQGVMFYISLC